MRKRKALIFAATTILVSPVYAETCPDPIAEASRLVLVTTRSMDTQLATMQLFTRQSSCFASIFFCFLDDGFLRILLTRAD